jgi:signal transduction histidine kinase
MNEITLLDDREIVTLTRDLLNRTLREIMAVVHAECGSLFVFDPEHKELVMSSFYNVVDLHIKGMRQKIGEGISGKVADTKDPVLVKDITEDTRFHCNGYKHYRTNSFISIPIVDTFGSAQRPAFRPDPPDYVVQAGRECVALNINPEQSQRVDSDKLLGLINIADKADGKPFTQDDLNVAVTLSSYASLALHSINGYAQLKKEKESLDKQKALLEKYASVGKLSAGIVHEVNNPLDGIIRYTDMLLNRAEENSVDREYLQEIKNGLNRIAGTTKSLLEFSHQINDSSRAKQYIDVHKTIDKTLNALGEKFFKTVVVNRRYKENLPKILDLGLPHIIINIVKNALDAMAQGGVLEVTTDIDDYRLGITIKDTGCGIKEEILEHIFVPFYTTKSMSKGSGLGLAICKEIIDRYKGTIKVQSSPGKGASFLVSIPRRYIENA